MNYFLPGFDFEVSFYEALDNAQRSLKITLEMHSIRNSTRQETVIHLKAERDQILQEIYNTSIGHLNCNFILTNLNSAYLWKELVVRVLRDVKNGPDKNVGSVALKYLQLVENVCYINELNLYIKEHQGKNENTPQPSFLELFREPSHAKIVKSRLEENGYTINGKWQGESGNKGELHAAYAVLKAQQILKNSKLTPAIRVFYHEFGLEVGVYIDERTLRNVPPQKDYERFEQLFSDLK